ncbi:MAG: hypothetical protein R6V56_05335 [Lentisphaeria bacterium]
MQKLFYTIAFIVLSGIILAGTGMAWSWHRAPRPKVVKSQLVPEGPWQVGDTIQCRTTLEMPWYNWPSKAEISKLPRGLQPVEQQSIKLRSIGWGVWRWDISRPIQPYEFGSFEGPAMAIRVRPEKLSGKRSVAAEFKQVTVKPRPLKQGEVQITPAPGIANPIQTGKHAWIYWLGLGFLIMLVLMTLLAIFLRKEGIGAVTQPLPEDIARHRLAELQADLPMPADPFFVRLTDTIREYIEQRLRLKAAEQTTEEFLQDLGQRKLLTCDQGQKLKDFLSSADLIKFARQSATEAQMQEALRGGFELVESIAEQHYEYSAQTDTETVADNRQDTNPQTGGDA